MITTVQARRKEKRGAPLSPREGKQRQYSRQVHPYIQPHVFYKTIFKKKTRSIVRRTRREKRNRAGGRRRGKEIGGGDTGPQLGFLLRFRGLTAKAVLRHREVLVATGNRQQPRARIRGSQKLGILRDGEGELGRPNDSDKHQQPAYKRKSND